MRPAISGAVAVTDLENPFADLAAFGTRLRWWADHGAEGVVFYDNLLGFYDLTPGQIDALRSTVEGAGLAIPVFNALRKSLHDPALAERDERRLEYCLEAAAALGAEILDVSVCAPLPAGRAASGWEPHPLYLGSEASTAVFERVAERLRPIARRCAQASMKLAIELHDDGIHDTAQRCLALLRLIDEPNVGVNPDLGNWYRTPHEHERSWREELAALAPHTIYWEVKNYQRVVLTELGRAIAWPAEIDEGDIDFREAAVVLRKAGFDGWVCNEGGHGDRVRSNLRYLRYFRWILDEWDAMRSSPVS